jgi:hypothetical protein
VKKSWIGILLAASLVAGTANAVPCGGLSSGGVMGAVGCQNGAVNDLTDSAADLNGGSYFGFNNWQLLDRTDNGVDATRWSVSGTGNGMGMLSLAPGLWNQFTSIAVVISTAANTSSGIHWSAYLLPFDKYGSYLWTFDWSHNANNLSLYARNAVSAAGTRVAEPQTLALVATGLLAVYLVQRRRVAVRSR